jgi:hypothetical protein
MANSIWTWAKKYGLWILSGVLLLCWFISKLIPTVRGRPEILQKAKDEVAAAKEDTAKKAAELEVKMESNRKELDAIKAIEDEAERLRRLAEFANRR